MNNSSGSSGNAGAPAHRTPPAALDDISVEELPGFPDHGIDVDELPRAAQNRRERDPPDLHDVVTQQTEILAGMLAELRARQGQPAQQQPGVELATDPNFDWSRLILPPETSFQVPGDGQVQRMATSLFARRDTCRSGST